MAKKTGKKSEELKDHQKKPLMLFFNKVFTKIQSFALYLKKVIIRLKQYRQNSTRKSFQLQSDPVVFHASPFVLLYRISVYAVFAMLVIIFRENTVYLAENFLNLFHLKRIFRLETFNSFLLLKIINVVVLMLIIVAVLAIIIQFIRWAGMRVLICEDEFILEEKTLLYTHIERIPFVSVAGVKTRSNTLEELLGFGKVTVVAHPENGVVHIKGINQPEKIVKILLEKTKSLKLKTGQL